MGVYHGTGYFITEQALKNVSLTELEDFYPEIRQHLLRGKAARNIDAVENLLDLFRFSGLATTESIIQYEEPVCFVGEFKKILNESEADPDSGDAEMIEKLKAEDGYDYAVSHEDDNLSHILEMTVALLKNFELIGAHDVLETYWFLMPFGE